jgi:hypothetical protein
MILAFHITLNNKEFFKFNNCFIIDSARKGNKKAANAKLNKNRIYIGDEYDRWMEIKTALRLETNSEVAKILLDR